jgi:hypothetical protein
MTYQQRGDLTEIIEYGIGKTGTPATAVNSVVPITTWSHARVSVASNVFTIPVGYRAVLYMGLYTEPVTAANPLTQQTRWYNETTGQYIGVSAQAISNTSYGSGYIRNPCAIATVDASLGAVQVSVRLSFNANSNPFRFVGTRVDYLGDSWVSIITIKNEAP